MGLLIIRQEYCYYPEIPQFCPLAVRCVPLCMLCARSAQTPPGATVQCLLPVIWFKPTLFPMLRWRRSILLPRKAHLHLPNPPPPLASSAYLIL